MKLLITLFFPIRTNCVQGGLSFVNLAGTAFYLLALLGLSACAEHYRQGQSLEQQSRFEEAALAYQQELSRSPNRARYQAALERVNQQAARQNFLAYRRYLTQQQPQKAYNRLESTLRQDPDLPAAKQEIKKWTKVLLAGQMQIELKENFRQILNLSEKVQFIVQINTPVPTETISANVQPQSGIFFVEHLLYNLPPEKLALYSLRSLSVQFTQAASQSALEPHRKSPPNTPQAPGKPQVIRLQLTNYGIPKLNRINGSFGISSSNSQTLQAVKQHRDTIQDANSRFPLRLPLINPSYSLNLRPGLVRYTAPRGGDFLPRFVYINSNRQVSWIDFGRYQVRQVVGQAQHRWSRLSLQKSDYFDVLVSNLVLQSYFQYQGKVVRYEYAQ